MAFQRIGVEPRHYLTPKPRLVAHGVAVVPLPFATAPVPFADRHGALAVHFRIAAWIVAGRRLSRERLARRDEGLIRLRDFHSRNARVAMPAPPFDDRLSAGGARNRHESKRLRLRRAQVSLAYGRGCEDLRSVSCSGD
ncbi:MAG: hypothetical protein WAK11_05130 [Candidatus Cybelea sp.]